MKSKATGLNFSVVILAAGNSSRMGLPKSILKYSESTTFLENIIVENIRCGCDEIVVVLNEENEKPIKENLIYIPEEVKIVINRNPELDRFHSVKTGLHNLEKNQPVFIVNVDNPFTDIDVIYALLNGIAGADYACPIYSGKGGHPVLLSQKLVKAIVAETKPQFNFKEYLKNHSRKSVEVSNEKVLVNINTMEDYLRWFG